MYVTEVVVDNFALLEPRQNGGMNQSGVQQPFNNNQQSFGAQAPQYGSQPQPGNNAPQSNPSPSMDNGFDPNQNAGNQFPGSSDDGGQSIDLADDELPF